MCISLCKMLGDAMKTSVLAVVVLYKIPARDCASVTSLARAIHATSSEALRFRVVLADNSPGVSTSPGIFPQEMYCSFPENRGLAHAYNMALAMAEKDGFDWLLTLDQDTLLPEDFLSDLTKTIELVQNDPAIGAVVPQMYHAGRVISPYTFRWAAVPKWLPSGFTGIPNSSVYALNSASVLRVNSLWQVGGYDPRFWLDASDHSMFHSLAAHGKRVFVAGRIQVQHQLSVLGRSSMPAARYENMLAAESAFWDLHMNRLANIERTARLVFRLMRQVRRGEVELQRVSWRYLRLRVLRSRKYRLKIWASKQEGQAYGSIQDSTLRPRVSVCMASYNGERFIKEQIDSILPQLQDSDELIVVDDASSDRTKEHILQFSDPRIKLIEHVENRGVVETFEHAIRCAVGDVLFLCDGDDIWAHDKVAKVLRAFTDSPRAQVVCTGLRLIDESGLPIGDHDYMKNREFSGSLVMNLVRNRFQGSAMAFRSSLLPKFLPIPKRRKFLHDAWIGMCNAITGGDAVYLPEPLLYYRRHSNNVSQPMGLREQILKRVQLIVDLAVHWLQLPRAPRITRPIDTSRRVNKI